jgi:hypothetical protein
MAETEQEVQASLRGLCMEYVHKAEQVCKQAILRRAHATKACDLEDLSGFLEMVQCHFFNKEPLPRGAGAPSAASIDVWKVLCHKMDKQTSGV